MALAAGESLSVLCAVTAPPTTTRGAYVRQEERDAADVFDEFVRGRLPELLRFGRALTGNEADAADLVQDALERTLASWSRIQSRDDPEGYVRRVMVNRNISVWRKLRRERITDELPDSGHHDRHEDSELWRALRALPPRQRAVIALRYYEDMTEQQVAQILGCTVGTVKSQSAKALTKLRIAADTFSDRGLGAGGES
ncbi:MAG: SigE family RNA polymerase sigma factor [Nocardioidaceae bacterium]